MGPVWERRSQATTNSITANRTTRTHRRINLSPRPGRRSSHPSIRSRLKSRAVVLSCPAQVQHSTCRRLGVAASQTDPKPSIAPPALDVPADAKPLTTTQAEPIDKPLAEKQPAKSAARRSVRRPTVRHRTSRRPKALSRRGAQGIAAACSGTSRAKRWRVESHDLWPAGFRPDSVELERLERNGLEFNHLEFNRVDVDSRDRHSPDCTGNQISRRRQYLFGGPAVGNRVALRGSCGLSRRRNGRRRRSAGTAATPIEYREDRAAKRAARPAAHLFDPGEKRRSKRRETLSSKTGFPRAPNFPEPFREPS